MMGVLTAAALSAGCAVSAKVFLDAYRREDHKRAFWWKGLAAVCFTAVGLVLLSRGEGSGFARMTVWGLFFGLIGDQFLAARLIYKKQHDLLFTIGALSFAVGHGWYVFALRSLGTLRWEIVLPVFALGAVLSLRYAARMGTDLGEKKAVGMAYVAVVLMMAAVAVGTAVATGSAAAILFSFGGVLFCVSDNILCAYCYGKAPLWRMNRDLHIAYYGAQLAIAWSILLA